MQYFDEPLFRIGGNYVTAKGLIAFAIFFGVGLSLAKIFQSEQFRRLLTRLKLGKNFASIIPTIFGLATLIFFTVTADQCCGCSIGVESAAPRHFAYSRSNFPARCPAPGGFLDIGAHQIISV